MDRAAAEQILHNVLQADEKVRCEAERTIKVLMQNNFPQFIAIYGQIMLDTSVSLKLRHIASIILKNSFHSKNAKIQKSYEQNWLSCPENFRSEFKAILESNFNCKDKQILYNIAKISGSIARIEIFNDVKNDFFKRIYAMLSSQDFAIGALEAAAVACDQLYDETDYIFNSNQHDIFRIAVFYQSVPAVSQDLILQNLRFIQSSLEIYEQILENEQIKRDFIASLFNLNNKNEDTIEKTLEVINRFIDIYHHKLKNELSDICEFFNSFIKNNQDFAMLQVFEFWTLMAELKYDFLIKKSFPILLPKLFSCLTKEEITETEWTEHKAASSLLVLLTDEFESGILLDGLSQNFIISNLQSSNPESRAIGAIALASVCQPKCSEFLYNSLSFLIADLGNPVSENEALFAISRICEKDIAVTINFLPTIIEKAGVIISNKSESSENAAWVYFSILSAAKNTRLNEINSIIEFNFMNMLSILVNRLESTQPVEYSLRNALNSALVELISSCPSNLTELLEKFTDFLVSKISESLNYFDSIQKDQIVMLEDIISNHIVLLHSCLSQRKSFDVNQITNLFTSCLRTPENASYGEVYIAVSKLLNPMAQNLSNFMPFILRDVESKDVFILKSALNLLSDIAIESQYSFVEYAPKVVPALINTISSPNTPLELKPNVINAFGDLALAIGVQFEPYIEMSIILFEQINSLNREGDEEYVDSLRNSVLHLFNCIFLAVGDRTEMRKHLSRILELIKKAITEDKDGTYRESSVNILVDMKNLFGTKTISSDWIKSYLLAVSTGKDDSASIKARQLYDSY